MSKSRVKVDSLISEHSNFKPERHRPTLRPRNTIRLWLLITLTALLLCFQISPTFRKYLNGICHDRTLALWKTSHSPTAVPPTSIKADFPDLYEASILELQEGLDSGLFSSVDLVRAYSARIEEVNTKGPALRAVLEINPSALGKARSLDKERKKKGKRSLMHGIPILLKDIIGTVASEGMNTSAGSYSLLGSIVPDDAGVVKRLRKAGAIILGKSNLSEFSHMRGDTSLALGWSALGGQSTGAYYPSADPCGSSSGSAVAVSVGLVSVALGSETDGSITCPAGYNNVVGVKPSVGRTSRAGVIPITLHQDTIGPLTRSLHDSAIVLSIIAGPDKNDNITLSQPLPVPDYTLVLSSESRAYGLRGKRIGVPRRVFMDPEGTDEDEDNVYVNKAFEGALDVMRAMGAEIVDPADLETADEMMLSKGEVLVADTDFKIQINAYFESLLHNPSGVRSLADLIAFNDAHPELEKPSGYESQKALIRAQKTQGRDAAFWEALAYNVELGGTRGIDKTLDGYRLDALVLPAAGLRASMPAALAGYPIVTVPMGFYPPNTRPKSTGPQTVYPAPGVPIGVSFFGRAYDEYALIGMAGAFEARTRAGARLGKRAFEGAAPMTQLGDVVGK